MPSEQNFNGDYYKAFIKSLIITKSYLPPKPHQDTTTHKPPKKNTEGIFIYNPQTLPLRKIEKNLILIQ